MKDILSFSVPGSDSIQEVQLGLTLIRFAEFNLGYFREQCVSYYRKNEPDDFMDKAPHLKEYLHSCHPYCKALLGTEFDKITLDCVIDDIYVKDGIGPEELWARNIAAQDLLGQALFRRITDYKTGRAINQWTNLARMQAYAASKMSFIYGGADDAAIHKARKLYYDLVFSLTAAELGFSDADLPVAEVSSVPFLPQSGAIMKTAANTARPVVKALMSDGGARAPLKGDGCVRDLMAGVVLKAMAGFKMPGDEEIDLMVRKYGALPGAVYRPVGFKAMIDIEFDQMLEKGFYIQIDGKNHQRLKYSSKKEPIQEKQETPADITPPAPVTGPEVKALLVEASPISVPASITPAGMIPPNISWTDISPQDAEALIAAMQIPVGRTRLKEKTTAKTRKKPEIKPASTEEPAAAEQKTVAVPKDIPVEIETGSTGKVKKIIGLAEDQKRTPTKTRTLQEVNTRCNLIWTSMNVRTGWSITAEDASEWFRYLTRLRYGINKGELTPGALDKFLDATQEVYQLLPENASF